MKLCEECNIPVHEYYETLCEECYDYYMCGDVPTASIVAKRKKEIIHKFYIVTTFLDYYDEDIIYLFDKDGRMIMSGDWYHDKIKYQIKGFFQGLDYEGIKYEIINGYYKEGE